MHSSDLLVEALNRYEGSYILVSHDRYFISKTANKIWEIVDHEIKEFKGGYEEYVSWKDRMSRESTAEIQSKNKELTTGNQQTVTSNQPTKNSKQPTTNNQQQPSAKSTIKKELQKQQKIFQQLEEKISKINEKKQQLEAALADPATYSDKNKFLQTENDYKKVSEELIKVNSEYEKVFEKIMDLESQ
jgi:ATP-binding cassette subfamily F protein 3